MNYKLIKFLETKYSKQGYLVEQKIEEVADMPNDIFDDTYQKNDNIIKYLKHNNIPTDETYCIVKLTKDGELIQPYAMLFGEFVTDDGEFVEMGVDVVEWDYKVMCQVAYKDRLKE